MIKLAHWMLYALTLQLFLFSLSFPVLVAWGIAFSPLVFLGNLLFTPFLTLFLGLSCGIYILELFYLPSAWLCWLLNGVAAVWMVFLASAPEIPLIACPAAPWWVLLLMPLGTSVIIKTYGLRGLKVLLVSALWVGIVFCGIKKIFTPHYKTIVIECGSKKIQATLHGRHVTLQDSQSALSSRACSQAWCDYTLSGQLIKNFGATKIDQLRVPCLTQKNKANIQRLCSKYGCDSVVDCNGKVLQI